MVGQRITHSGDADSCLGRFPCAPGFLVYIFSEQPNPNAHQVTDPDKANDYTNDHAYTTDELHTARVRHRRPYILDYVAGSSSREDPISSIRRSTS